MAAETLAKTHWSNTDLASLEKKNFVGTKVRLLTRVPDSSDVRNGTVSLLCALFAVGGVGTEGGREGGRGWVFVKHGVSIFKARLEEETVIDCETIHPRRLGTSTALVVRDCLCILPVRTANQGISRQDRMRLVRATRPELPLRTGENRLPRGRPPVGVRAHRQRARSARHVRARIAR